MSIEIRPIAPTKKELTRAVKFAIDLYRGNDCYVPPLVFDEVNTLMPSKIRRSTIARPRPSWHTPTGVPPDV